MQHESHDAHPAHANTIPVAATIIARDPNLATALGRMLHAETGLRIVEGEPSGLVFFELGEDPEQDFLRIGRMQADPAVREVVLLVAETDAETLIHAMRAGLKECLVLADTEHGPAPAADELRQALARHRERCAAEYAALDTPTAASAARRSKGRIIDVFGCKGGVGVTTVAVNLAHALQAAAGEDTPSVVLVDMHMPFGETPLFLDIEPMYDWGDAARNFDRLDATFLMSLLTRHPSGLHVLPGPAGPGGDAAFTPQVLERMFDLLARHFDYVVVDGGSYLDEFSLRIMELSNQILEVAVLSLPCLANAKKLHEALDRFETLPRERFRLVFNRHLSTSEISVEDAEAILARKHFLLLPNDYSGTLSAINQGRPVVEAAPKSPVNKAVSRLSVMLADNRTQVGDEEATREGGVLSRMFRRFKSGKGEGKGEGEGAVAQAASGEPRSTAQGTV